MVVTLVARFPFSGKENVFIEVKYSKPGLNLWPLTIILTQQTLLFMKLTQEVYLAEEPLHLLHPILILFTKDSAKTIHRVKK